MNDISKYLISINRHPYVGGKKITIATPCMSYGQASWFIAFAEGYAHINNPIFTDEDGCNSSRTITEYAKNLGYYDFN